MKFKSRHISESKYGVILTDITAGRCVINMNLRVGIVGLPNAGKSTLFNALLKKQVAFAANYPFATIEPNVGVVPVPDRRLEFIAETIASQNSKSQAPNSKQISNPNFQFQNKEKWPPIVPATVEFVDIAGLVKGASTGEGLGNKFLAHIREVDLICHVIRYFKDASVIHVMGDEDVNRDREVVEAELMLADLQTLEKSQKSEVKSQNLNSKFKSDAVDKLYNGLNKGKLAKDVELTDQEKEAAKELHLLTMKAVFYVLNVSESELTQSVIPNSFRDPQNGKEEILKQVFDREAQTESVQNDIILISAKIESELAGLSDEEQKEYLKTLGLEKSGLERLIQKAYQKLGLISFLTGGEKEVRAWTIKQDTKAPQAAGVIHTDFEKKFIKAEVVSYDLFVELGGWARSREKGAVRLEGQDYIMKDGDVVDFKVGV